MQDPKPRGHWTASLAQTAFQDKLSVGKRYVVIRAFADFDVDIHPVGESWWFLTSNFLPYEDGLTLIVSLDGEREWQIRLQWRQEGQAAIIDDLASYIRPV